MYLEDSRGRRHERERGLNTTGGINGESGLNKLPLKVEGRVSGGLDVTGVLLRGPLAAGVAENKCEHSHGFCSLVEKLKSRREQCSTDGTFEWNESFMYRWDFGTLMRC